MDSERCIRICLVFFFFRSVAALATKMYLHNTGNITLIYQICYILYIMTTVESRNLITNVRSSTSNCEQGWSKWLDKDSPKTSLYGDHELLTDTAKNKFCAGGVITRIECRSSIFSDVFSKQELTCNLETGLSCRNVDNAPNGCRNYRVRYYCQCPSQTKTRFARHVHCPSWSPWYNDHTPTSADHFDRETRTRSELDTFCPSGVGGDLSAVQCRDTKGEAFTGTRDVVSYKSTCDLHTGLTCTPKSGFSCADFSVRYCCRFSQTPPVPTSTKAAVSSSPTTSLSTVLISSTSYRPSGVSSTGTLIPSSSSSIDFPTSTDTSQHSSGLTSLKITENIETDLSTLLCKKSFILLAVICISIILILCHCCLTYRIYRKLLTRVKDTPRNITKVLPMNTKW